MANPDSAFGLKPVRKIDGSMDFAIVRCNVPATDSVNLMTGDAVRLAGSSGSVNQDQNYPTVDRVAAGENIFGVMVGVCDVLQDSKTYREASVNTDIMVCLARDTIFHVQEDSDSATLAATDVGQDIDLVVADGDTTSGASKMELDSSSATTSGQLKLMRLADVIRNGLLNEIGANAVWECVVNENQLADASAGV